MDLQHYRSFTRQLTLNLEREHGVLGLIAAGSMAEGSHLPDRWSDHDFWVITEPGHQQRLRDHHGWLPAAADIILAYQENQHGVKVLYREGAHLLEYAVFDLEELTRYGRANDYQVLLDRAGLEQRMAELRASVQRQVAASYTDDRWLVGQVLTNLLVGVGRHHRGEQLCAHKFVAGFALELLLRLLQRHATASRPDLLDDLNPWRRVELAYPEIGRKLVEALALPVPELALVMLDVVESNVRSRVPAISDAVWAVVRRELTTPP